MTHLALLALCTAPGDVKQSTFVQKAQRFFSAYKGYNTPVDQRPIYPITDPAVAERKRRDATMLAIAAKFDPRGFDKYSPGLSQRYRKEFYGGLLLRRKGVKLNDVKMQTDGYNEVSGFVFYVWVRWPDLFPKDYHKPLPIPAVWRPKGAKRP